jgi:hypothetical protein
VLENDKGRALEYLAAAMKYVESDVKMAEQKWVDGVKEARRRTYERWGGVPPN